MNRRTTSARGAIAPTRLYGGNRPIDVVVKPIMIIAKARHVLRPIRSPKWPNTIAPKGRATKPTADVLKEAMSATSGGRVAEKNNVGKTSAAAVPYMKKSYHSMLAPPRPTRADLSGLDAPELRELASIALGVLSFIEGVPPP